MKNKIRKKNLNPDKLGKSSFELPLDFVYDTNENFAIFWELGKLHFTPFHFLRQMARECKKCGKQVHVSQ